MKRKHKAHAGQNAAYNNIVNINSHKSKRIHVTPKNFSQEVYLKKLDQESNHILFAIGPAGTGKTMIAVQWAINEFKDRLCDKIVITRPAVSVDEQHGFLPGDLNEKMAPWTRPIFDVFSDNFCQAEIERQVREGIVEVAPLAYMRGRTFKNSVIIADEMQNATPSQMKMLLTRLGEGSKMVVPEICNRQTGLAIMGCFSSLSCITTLITINMWTYAAFQNRILKGMKRLKRY